MCGIAGVLSTNHDTAVLPKLEKLMHNLKHRGPDGSGMWESSEISGSSIKFGHHRLAICDLDDRANQPLTSPSGSVLIINGEIYNAPILRKELSGTYDFKTTSDFSLL